MIAGSDTTATASANILYFLMSHPTAYKRLQAEVDGLGDEITDCSAQLQLPYLNAVMYVARFPKDKKSLYLYSMIFLVTKVSDYYPPSCLASNVLQRKEVAEGWLDHCKLPPIFDSLLLKIIQFIFQLSS
jgi:hypothetical protein